MFKVPEHQVAGHQAVNGNLGPLIDNSGHFYKPLQSNDRGTKELEFYKSFSSNTMIPYRIRRFFPIFHGTQLIEVSDGSGLQPHLILEDLVSCYHNPSVIDIKIGQRTWYPQASEDYIKKCQKKDAETSSTMLGFRLSGLQVYYNNGSEKGSGFWKRDKKFLQNLSAEEVKLVLKKFVSSNIDRCDNSGKLGPNSCLASSVYGGLNGILAQLLELKAWFEDQTIYHFNSCSVLMAYEKEHAMVKLIDFAHVVEGNGIIDHNFLGGLCSLIKMISEIVDKSLCSNSK